MTPQNYELVSIDSVTPHPDNPRRGDVDRIAASIEAHGFYGYLVVQRSTGHVLKGNHTLAAAKQVGMTEIPVAYLDVADDQALAILLDDNRLSDLGTMDDDALARLLAELDTELVVGWDDDDIDEIVRAAGGFGDEAAAFLSGVGDEGASDDADAPSDPGPSNPAEPSTPGDDKPVYFQLGYTVTLEQRQAILDAIKAWRDEGDGETTSAEALAGVCSSWLIASGNATTD